MNYGSGRDGNGEAFPFSNSIFQVIFVHSSWILQAILVNDNGEEHANYPTSAAHPLHNSSYSLLVSVATPVHPMLLKRSGVWPPGAT